MDDKLISYILSRKSVRSYDQRPFDPADKTRVDLILKNTNFLVPGNQFRVLFKSREKGEDLVSILGAYGRFIIPPYYLLPYLIGEDQAYIDLGYHVEQIAVQLWSKGIGSCFIGCLSRQDKVRANFGLPNQVKVAAFLVIGYPSEKIGMGSVSKNVKSILGIRNRLPVEEICFLGSFRKHFNPEDKWKLIIEAGRMAPSAVNAQPWRFLLKDDALFIFSVQNGRKYLLPENKFYALHDCGICMANMDLALHSLGLQGKWTFLRESEKKILDFPQELSPLAKLTIESKRVK